MKSDLLEQIGFDWMQQKPGIFVKANLKYRPLQNNTTKEFNNEKDIIYSDIDLLAIDINDIETVTVINCKSWMDGFDFKNFHLHLSESSKHTRKFGGKEYWKHFRDLVDAKWHQGFIDRIKKENKHFKKLKYIILNVLSKNKDFTNEWKRNKFIVDNFKESSIDLVSIESKEIKELLTDIDTGNSTYAENSEFIRVLQLLRKAKVLE